MNSADLFLWILDNLNYWVVTLFMAIESSFVPFPSEVVVPPAAWKAMDPNSGMSFVLVVVFATIGADLGALVNYYLQSGWVAPSCISLQTAASATCVLSTARRWRRRSLSSVSMVLPLHSSAAWCRLCVSSSVFRLDCRECALANF